MKMTNKQKLIYDFIVNYTNTHNYPPTIREIATGVGLSSTATVHTHLNNLMKLGYLVKSNNKNRALEIVDNSTAKIKNTISEAINVVTVPKLGRVTAGNPIEAIETPNEYTDLPASMVKSKAEVFTLEVVGDSMINVGIFDGDTVIVEKTQDVRNGEIVVAMTDQFEVTLKTFYKEKQYFRLQPENDNLEPIILKEVTIIGKATGLYRKI